MLNLLPPAIGEELLCHAFILKNGKTLIVAESEVYSINRGREKLVAKATVSLAVVGRST